MKLGLKKKLEAMTKKFSDLVTKATVLEEDGKNDNKIFEEA